MSQKNHPYRIKINNGLQFYCLYTLYEEKLEV